MIEKQTIRRKMRQLRDQLEGVEKDRLDALIREQLQQLIEQRPIRVVHTFLPIGSEIDLLPLVDQLLKRNIRVVLPKTLPDRQLEHRVLHSLEELTTGILGTRHPVRREIHTGTYDLIIVPGLAFDRTRQRLGYGQGYYDRFLSEHTEALKVGVCYPFQLVDQLPSEAHDIPMDQLIS